MRRNNGRYATPEQFIVDKFTPLFLMILSAVFAWSIQKGADLARASEGEGANNASWVETAMPDTTPSPTPTITPESVLLVNEPEELIPSTVGEKSQAPLESEILHYIVDVFGKDAVNAIKIAQCESRLNPETIGDQHIMGTLNGEEIGDSVGIFQIRTGDAGVYDGKAWNRARANGMTVAEFREQLKDYRYNIDYAKDMFDRGGWDQWWNCKQKNGI